MNYDTYGLENEELYIEPVDPDPTTCEHTWTERYIDNDTFYLCDKCHSIITATEYEAGQDDIPF